MKTVYLNPRVASKFFKFTYFERANSSVPLFAAVLAKSFQEASEYLSHNMDIREFYPVDPSSIVEVTDEKEKTEFYKNGDVSVAK